MDGFTEKKWFAYLGDHHEGPFSVEDIQNKIGQGQLSSTNYIWAEGMPDWKPMSEVEYFQPLLRPPVAPPPAPPAAPALEVEAELAPPVAPVQEEPLHPEIQEPVLEISKGMRPISDSAPELEEEPIHPVAGTVESPSRSIMAAPLLTATSENADAQTGSRYLYQKNEDGNEPQFTGTSTYIGEMPKERSLVPSIMKIAALFLVFGGIGTAFYQGYFAPFFGSQMFKAGGQALSSATDPIMDMLSENMPFIYSFFSPIPRLENVKPEEIEQLKAAAIAKLDQTGPQIAIALDQSDLLNPVFYLGTNLPDGAIFDIYIEGIPDTLMNHLSFSAKTQAAVTKKLARSGVLQFAKGTTFPRGQYKLYVVDPGTQSDAVKQQLARMVTPPSDADPSLIPKGLRVVATKSYFLGGFRDALYTARLKEFHDKLIAKAQQELTEMKQVAMTYEQLLTTTDQMFEKLRKGKRLGNAQKKAWNDFNTQWEKMNAQLSANFSQQTPESRDADYFYGFLYQMGQQTSDAVTKLHALQSTLFSGGVLDPKAFEIQLGESTASAHSAVEALKAKTEQIEKLPPTASGLPQRDGIQ